MTIPESFVPIVRLWAETGRSPLEFTVGTPDTEVSEPILDVDKLEKLDEWLRRFHVEHAPYELTRALCALPACGVVVLLMLYDLLRCADDSQPGDRIQTFADLAAAVGVPESALRAAWDAWDPTGDVRHETCMHRVVRMAASLGLLPPAV